MPVALGKPIRTEKPGRCSRCFSEGVSVVSSVSVNDDESIVSVELVGKEHPEEGVCGKCVEVIERRQHYRGRLLKRKANNEANEEEEKEEDKKGKNKKNKNKKNKNKKNKNKNNVGEQEQEQEQDGMKNI